MVSVDGRVYREIVLDTQTLEAFPQAQRIYRKELRIDIIALEALWYTTFYIKDNQEIRGSKGCLKRNTQRRIDLDRFRNIQGWNPTVIEKWSCAS